MVDYTEPTGDTLDFTGATEYTEGSGDVLDFELVLATQAQLPARSLTLSRQAPTATGVGAATANNPVRTLQLSRQAPTVSVIASLPNRDLQLSRQVPTATGAGTVQAQAPNRNLQLSRQVPRAGFVRWLIDNAEIGANTGETTTHSVLTLSQRVETSTLTDVLRPLKSDEGQVSILPSDDGGFVAVDRANGGNTFTLTPPVKREPLRQEISAHVQRYEEEMVSQTVDEWNVEIEFARNEDRTDTPSISDTRDTGEWAFDTRYGQIATGKVDAEFIGTGEGGIERFEVIMRLTKEQARVWESAYALVEGTRIREIPDATNQVQDDTGGNSTTTVTSPASDTVVADGDYVVLAWESTRLNDAFQEISATIATTN